MGYLSEALRRYYIKKNRRIKFTNNLSLNEFALFLWEKSNDCGIDSSILSKVLGGKRLFTPLQLNVFCDALKLDVKDKEYLFYCLNKDYNIRHGFKNTSLFVPSTNTLDFLEELKEEAKNLLAVGKCDELLKITSITEAYLKNLVYRSKLNSYEDKLNKIYAEVLYLKGRAIGSISTSSEVIKETNAISNIIKIHAVISKKISILAYSNSLKSNAYYVKGSYSNQIDNKYLNKAIDLGKEALKILPTNDSEFTFTLRTMIASSINLGDKELFLRLSNLAKKVIFSQPQENYLNSIHLAGTISKGLAKYHLGEPFRIKENVEKYFGRNIKGTRIYEISDIKSELETLLILKSTDKNYAKRKIQRAIDIADQENFIRHKEKLIEIAEAFSVNGIQP